MPDYSDLVPSQLKPAWSDGTDLKPSLTTSNYSGGTPSAANEVKPSLLKSDGSLKESLCSNGALKLSVAAASSWDYGPAHILTDWTVAGSITQESDGIVLEQGGNGITLLLDRMSFVPDKDYELKFEVAEDSANFGAIIYFGNTSGTGAYVPDVAVDLDDHTVTITSNYITDNGIYHRRISPPATLSEYRLRIVRNGGHTGTQKLKNISVREL